MAAPVWFSAPSSPSDAADRVLWAAAAAFLAGNSDWGFALRDELALLQYLFEKQGATYFMKCLFFIADSLAVHGLMILSDGETY